LELVDKKGTVRYSYPKGAKARSIQPAEPSAPTKQAESLYDTTRKYLSSNPKAFDYFQQKYPHVATIDEFSETELKSIYETLKSNNKIA
jgi:hypothetical protein